MQCGFNRALPLLCVNDFVFQIINLYDDDDEFQEVQLISIRLDENHTVSQKIFLIVNGFRRLKLFTPSIVMKHYYNANDRDSPLIDFSFS